MRRDMFARRMRRTYGYIGEINLAKGGTPTTALLQIATKLPWRFGSPAIETARSFVIARIQAFLPNAVFDTPACVLRVGMPAVGCVEPSCGGARGEHLAAWGVENGGG